MGPWITILRRHRVVRASAAGLFLYGVAGAATSPYQSIVAIRELGLSDGAYAAMALAASVANVVLAIGAGLLADRFHIYRRPLIVVAAAGVLGYGLIWAVPSAAVFVLATVGPLALFHSVNSLLFGSVRAQTARFAPEEAAIVMALLRIMISLAWVVVPGVTGLLLAGQDSMIPAWAMAALLAGGCLMAVTFWMEADPPPPADRPAPRMLGDLSLVLAPGLLARVLGVALISQVLHVNAAVLPLIVTGSAGGRTADVGYLVGMVAALEVVFMVVWARAATGVPLTFTLLANAALYMGYLGALAMATAPWHVYAASLVAGVSAAALVSLPIGYLLDLIRDRPGLSGSLLAVNMFAGGALGAGVFALGTALGGYGAAAVLSGLCGVLGAAMLMGLERGRT